MDLLPGDRIFALEPSIYNAIEVSYLKMMWLKEIAEEIKRRGQLIQNFLTGQRCIYACVFNSYMSNMLTYPCLYNRICLLLILYNY